MAQHIVLPIFEGPLDLLLFLINRSQIDIKDIFISNITEQYLEYTSSIVIDNMENRSTFLIMAARLLEIKSQKLLPKRVKSMLSSIGFAECCANLLKTKSQKTAAP